MAVQGCGSGPDGNGLPDASSIDPVNPPLADSPAPSTADPATPPEAEPGRDEEQLARSYTTAVLLFNGVGISTSDWQNTERIVKSMGLSYRLVNSSQLEAMSVNDIAKFGMILVPGGHGNRITSGLSSAARIRVRQAVRDRGVNYLGICAGAFVGVERGANTNAVTSYGFPAIEGSHLRMWYPPGNSSAIADIVKVFFPGGASRNLVWWGGPATPEWKGGVVARYANGKAAISQGWNNKSLVIVSGPHPEAPQGWRATAGYDPDGLDYDIMKSLIRATLTRTPLPSF